MRDLTSETEIHRLVQAAAWQIQLAEADAEGSLDFEAWRAADAQNAAAWNQLRGPWELLGEQAAAPELIEMRRAALAQTRHAGRYRWIRLMRRVLTARIAIAAGLLAIAIGGLFYWAG